MSAGAMLFRGGRVVDPSQSWDGIADLLVQHGRIAAIGRGLEAPANATVQDAAGKVVAPGLIDLHVHLREPGFEHKETIASGTAAAAAGGFTTVCCMPNTDPPLDSPSVLADLTQRIMADAAVRVLPIATITEGRRGERAVDFEALAVAGAVGFSDDGDSVMDSLVMRRALEASRSLDLPIMVHCEDKALTGGAMHEGDVSRRLGLAGLPAEAEEIVIARDLLLTALTGGWLHVCHVSTARGIAMVRRAKAEGVRVTAEVMPHHLTMTDEWVAGSRQLLHLEQEGDFSGEPCDPNTKVNPPLRTRSDAAGLLSALQGGDFDVIATDHAPHAIAEKSGTAYMGAAFGMSGLELAVPLCLGLVRSGHLSMSNLIERLSAAPGRLLRKGTGTLMVGAPADVVVIDPDAQWQVTAENLRTKSPNTPLLGMTLRGKAVLTMVDGKILHAA